MSQMTEDDFANKQTVAALESRVAVLEERIAKHEEKPANNRLLADWLESKKADKSWTWWTFATNKDGEYVTTSPR